ncbi:MAG: hypothetical protein V1742_06570 [Pseudomonadota bacterium]
MAEKKARTDELQALGDDQSKQVREFVDKKVEARVDYFETLPIGWEKVWEQRITPELCVLYADGVEDYNPWYDAWTKKGESPFGPAIAPPLLVSHWMKEMRHPTWSVGGIHVDHDSEILAPIPVGTLVRFRGKMTKKYIKKERRYYDREITVEDAETGKLFFRETRAAIVRYEKVSK